MDTLGRIEIPTYTPSGLTFPLVADYGFGFSRDWPVISHRFGELATLATQSFQVGLGNRRFHFQRQVISRTDRTALLEFYNDVQGSFQTFTYNAPDLDRTSTVPYQVIFDLQPLSIQSLANMCRTGMTFLECPDSTGAGTVYTTTDTLPRFPNDTLKLALLSQVQKIVPLVHIKVRDAAVPDLYLSDRRCTVDGQLYLPRLTDIGEPGGDSIMSQDISGAADNLQFSFGNADRMMSALSRDTGLKFASIDLCFLHVNTGILVQMWKGIVLRWTVDGTSAFRMQCSDGLYPITQNYPRRTITRQCWKTFNDGINCPWQSVTGGSTGNADSCDFLFNSPNGCLSHGMAPYFGGHPALPQSVVIKDNGTGVVAGIGRSTVTSTSIIADNLWGLPLAEIWCYDDGDPKKAFWANATVISVRDESTFEDILGIIGVGPIGEYEGMSIQTNEDGFKTLVAPFADGFPPQGFSVDSQLRVTGYHPDMGLREVIGTDPATESTDAFSLGQGTPQHWDIPDPNFGNVTPFAAGTAFVELRYQKDAAKGITPTTTGSHSMQIPIKRGLTGWIFDSTSRAAVPGLTNPFWIAVNTYLRALGLQNAPVEDQLSTFLIDSLVRQDGSGLGTAEIADLKVTPIIGVGVPHILMGGGMSVGDGDPLDVFVGGGLTETQFKYQGAITEFKPFRDHLTEILACALGYFTFEFGKLRLGIRENASVVSAFTLGNMLFQSLSITPAEEQFEFLKIDFANVDLQSQQDMVSYEDKDHSAYYNRSGAPLTSRQRVVGLSTLSQGLRIAATRVREEIGGIYRPDQPNPYIEWDNNNIVTFKTTLLSLEVGIGDVISVTHPDLATYPEPMGSYNVPTDNTWKFRVIRWTLHKDWSITIVAKSVTESMYDLTIGPKPLDVLPTPLPALFYPIPLGPQWAPYQIQAGADDPLFPSEWNFETQQAYITLKDGSSATQEVATGKLPVTSFTPATGAPIIHHIDQSTTGGVIPGGTSWRMTICAYDAKGRPTPPAEIRIVHIKTGTMTNSVDLTRIAWPKKVGLVSYTVFTSDRDDLICGQQSGDLTPTGDGTSYTPITITVTGPFARSTFSLPSPWVSRLRLKVKNGGISGVMRGPVTAVATNLITVSDFIDDGSHGGAFDPTGRVMSVTGRADHITNGPTPFWSALITGYDGTTGEFTLDRDPDGVVLAEDIVVVRMKADIANSPPYLSVRDTGHLNITNIAPDGTPTAYIGFNPGELVGSLIRVISGTGRGETPRKILENDATSYTWDLPLQLDSSSVWVIEEPTWLFTGDSAMIHNSDPLKATDLRVQIANRTGPIMVYGFTVGTNAVESPDTDGPMREDWVFGTGDGGFVPVEKATFGFGLKTPVVVETDITNHYLVKAGGLAFRASVACKTGPTGTPLKINIEITSDEGLTWEPIFTPTNYIVVPIGSTDHLSFTGIFTDRLALVGDMLRISCIQAGGAAQDVEVVLEWRDPEA